MKKIVQTWDWNTPTWIQSIHWDTVKNSVVHLLNMTLDLGYFNIEEYPQLELLLKESWLYYEETESKNMIERKINRDSESIIVLRDKGKIIGCVFVVDSGNEFILSRLWVLWDYRKKWIWNRLIQAVKVLAKERGVKKITLFVWEWKTQLQEYYENLWFKLWNTYRTWKMFL